MIKRWNTVTSVSPCLMKKKDGMQVTILVATDGAVNLQKVNNSETLRAALNKLGGVRSDQVMLLPVAPCVPPSTATLQLDLCLN